MLNKFRHLRLRYQYAMFISRAAPRGIFDDKGVKIGFIDEIKFQNGSLRVQGWVHHCDHVTLELAEMSRSGVPDIMRVDVAQALGISPQLGFDLSIVMTADQFTQNPIAQMSFRSDTPEITIPSLKIDFSPLAWSYLRTNLKFARALVKATPSGLRWLMKRDPQDRARLRSMLSLDSDTPGITIDNTLLTPPEADSPAPHRITILLPVYNAFDLLPDVLSRVLQNTDIPYHLILIEDASPDGQVLPFLRDWIATNRADITVTLLENAQNLGFIGSVNRGLAASLDTSQPPLPIGCSEGPIVLLNSDAFVPAGWASRLIAPLLANSNVATSTPMSNDAEIMSVPVLCQISDLAAGDADVLDAAAARLNPAAASVTVPTGVGFCMAMARPWVTRLPTLDPVFGRGYGEEVDWCQKARAMWASHVAVGNLFVEHRGGSSFGSEAKQAMITRNNGIVSNRYPTFDAQVQDFITNDPLISARLALAITWAGLNADGLLPVYLAHSWGGGAESYLRARLKTDLAEIGAAIVLRVGGGLRWRIEVHTPKGIVQGDTDDTEFMISLVEFAPRRHLIYSCGVGFPDPADLPAVMLRLHDSAVGRLSVLVHDFFMISPSYTLLDADGQYRGPPLPDNTDSAHRFRTTKGAVIPVSQWQQKWYALLQATNEIVVFSTNSASILVAVWPALEDSIVVEPHSLSTPIEPVVRTGRTDTVILGVLGGINFAKGAQVVEILAQRRPDLSIVIVGNVDPAYSMPGNVTVVGQYEARDISALAVRYGITQWLIPSVWPETFSFTTHEALATRLPVIAFDLGAQGDAVRAADNGVMLRFTGSCHPDAGTLASYVVEHLEISTDTSAS